MKIKVLLFVNMVLLATAIGLYLYRPRDTAVVPSKTSPPGSEVVSNTPTQPANEIKSNNVPSTPVGAPNGHAPQ